MNFLTSKFSGYLSIILVVSLAAGAWYMYQRGVTFGELQEAAKELAAMEAEREARQKQLAEQARTLSEGRKEAARVRTDLQEARDAASDEFSRCFDMPVPDGMRIRQQ